MQKDKKIVIISKKKKKPESARVKLPNIQIKLWNWNNLKKIYKKKPKITQSFLIIIIKNSTKTSYRT